MMPNELPPQPVQSPVTVYIANVAPYLMQLIAITFLGVIAITTDGQVRTDIVGVLEATVLGNALAAGAIGVTHSIANAATQRTAFKTELQKAVNAGPTP
jgi:hypothetical protein